MADLPDGVTLWEGPPLDAWRPWTPTEAATRLEAIDVPWCVVGGWAIDLFLGEQTRAHDDLEIAVLRADFTTVRRALSGFALFVVGDGEVRALPPGALPPDGKHQNWVLDTDAYLWRMDVMLEPGDAETWTFRRDQSVHAPREFMVDRTAEAIPFLAPHGALLFKAKATRPKDEADFSACLPRLSPSARTWLRDAIQHAHPGHPWIEQLR